jgi:hypothetical protein
MRSAETVGETVSGTNGTVAFVTPVVVVSCVAGPRKGTGPYLYCARPTVRRF